MGLTALRVKKTIHRQNQIKPCGSWWYIEVCSRNNQPVQETEQYLYNFLPLIHHNVQLSWVRSQQPARDASMCSGIVACFFFTLKAMSPIDCHYMTDRLTDRPQRFELKIFICVLLKSPTSWMPWGYADKHHIFIFEWTIPLRHFNLNHCFWPKCKSIIHNDASSSE